MRLPLREPEAWTGHVDRALRRGVHDAVWKRMVGSLPPKGERANEAIGTVMLGTFVSLGMFTNPSEAAIALSCLWFGLNGRKAESAIRHSMPLQEQVISMVPFFHVDRAAIATGRVLTSRIVKTL